MAILKHIASKSSNYGAALEYIFIVQLYFMDFGGLPEVRKQCSISTILVFVNQLVGLLLSSSCFTGTSIRPNLLNIP